MFSLDTISIEQSIVTMFQLQIFAAVRVNVVNPELVALDSLELTFKDQYLGRSDMWRMKNSLIGSCVYMGKKLDSCHKSVHCKVSYMEAGTNEHSKHSFDPRFMKCGVKEKEFPVVSSRKKRKLFLDR